MMFLFIGKYAIKSIARRPKKNLGTVLAIALGVTLLIGVQVGSIALEQTLADNWYGTVGDTDLAVYNLQNPLFPANLSDTIQNTANLQNVNFISERLDLSLTFYFEKDGLLQKDVEVQGLQPQHIDDLGGFYTTDGSQLSATILDTPNTVLINEYLANQKGVTIGDTIRTSMADGKGGSSSLQLTVKGIVDPAKGQARQDFFGDTPIAYTNIVTLQSGLDPSMQDYVTQLNFQFSGVDRSIGALDIKAGSFPGKSIIRDNLEAVEQILSDVGGSYRVYSARIQVAEAIDSNVAGITSTLDLFVVILNLIGLLLIINVQAMGLDDRRYQTAVLRAMGSDRRQIFAVFLTESAMLGMIGSLIGVGLGIGYGNFIMNTIAGIFGLPASGMQGVFSGSLLLTAMIFGVALAVITAAVPAWFAASRSITAELRGIEIEQVEGRSIKVAILGLATLIGGLLAAQNVGKFWTDAAWTSFEDTTTILLALGLSIFGAGLLLSYINKRLGYNMAGLTIYGLALYALFDRLELITEGNGNNWLTIIMLYLVLGVVMIVVVNFDLFMKGLDVVLSLNPKIRAISQVSTRSMIAKKGRLAMVFSILTLVLVLNIFIAISAHSITESNVNAYDVRSRGVDIVINSDVPNAQIEQVVEQIDGVQQVYAFRSYFGPFFSEDPSAYSAEQLTSFLDFRRVVEVNQSTINPSGTWEGPDDLLFHTFRVNDITVDGVEYHHKLNLDRQEKDQLSKSLLNQFFDNSNVTYQAEVEDTAGNIVNTETRTGQMIIGDFFSDFYQDLYFQDKSGQVINTYSVGSQFSMMGDFEMVSGALMVTPELFAQLPGADMVKEPNLFLVKSTVGYFEQDKAVALAQQIETALNNLNDPNSLSSKEGVLLGATTRIVSEEVQALWENEAAFWDFLNIFSALGLIIGALGMIIIAIRSVAERTREIGMMRAIGFQRRSVVFTVGLELMFVSAVGLIAGLINGYFMVSAFLSLLLEVPASYPVPLLILYVLGVVFMAILAGLLPGIRASRVPPSEALRYTG